MLVGISNSDNSFDMNDVNNGDYDFCMIKLTNKYNTISGTVFADLNSNNTLDFGEPPLKNMKIKEQATGRTAFSNQNGDYNISVLDSGSFDVAPNALNNYNVNPVCITLIFRLSSI
ncbi:MAG: hypothetical protein IPG39_10540 [Bacteroidetes bacterium]|nr:hypothetical protein [Bacteroidota bacterium]